MDTPQSLSDFISAENLIKHLGISRPVLLGWLDHGLPYIRIGLRLYFREGSVAAWLAAQERTRGDGQSEPEDLAPGGQEVAPGA